MSRVADRFVQAAVPALALTLALAVVPRAHAADAKAEIEAHDKAFLAAYDNGETKKMKSEIAKAVALGEKSGLGSDPVMADTYVLAAILEVDGNDNKPAGVKDFVKALKIRPDVAIPKGMATSPVKAALKQARIEAGLAPKDGVAPAATVVAAKSADAPKDEAATKSDKAPPAAQKEPDKQDKQKEAEEAKQQEAKQQKDKQARDDAEAKQQKDKQARDDAEAKQAQAQAQSKEGEPKEHGDERGNNKQVAELKARAQQLEKDKADRDKQLADAKARIQQLEKDKADRDKQLADAKAHAQQTDKDRAERDKQLGGAAARAQQLEKDKADRDRQLADAKARIQQLERDKADRDKQLAETRAQEGKERESLEKIEHDRQVAETRQRDAENKQKQERQERERLFAGPEMPGHLREALTCAVPDEAPLRTDLFVHCVARPNVKAKSVVFYYRTFGAHYYSVPMERTAKGWYAAIVPGTRVMGKVLQYYAEALDGREAVVATNGKENSPNILSLRPGAPRG